MTFELLGLGPELLRAVVEEGYATPTPIQRAAIPPVLEGRDLVGSAQTGTGKTAAFMLPILHRLARRPGDGIRVLVLEPTRELAEQVLQSALTYGRHLEVTATAVYGGVGFEPQTRALRDAVDVVVATPGRLLDQMARGHVDLSRVETLVLDEADRMLDMGFAPDVRRILSALPVERQTLLFSATLSGDVDRLARRALREPVTVEIGGRAEPAAGVEHMLVAVGKSDKRGALQRVLAELPEPGRALVFTRTKHGAERLARQLRTERGRVAALHGGKTQAARNRALQRFREGEVRVLVATDVAARGIDVDDITMVVNYDVPQDPEVYVHRVGRTARAGATGVALTLMSPDEWLLMRDVERLLGRTFLREVLPGFEPAVAPVQPRDRSRPARPRGPSVRPRVGARRRA